MIRPKGLGRGLDALLAGGNEAEATHALQTIAIDRIRAGKFQPRTKMDETALNELAESIREQGVMQPILVRPVDGGRFEIVAGERRWRAAQRAGLQGRPGAGQERAGQQRACNGAHRKHPARGLESAGRGVRDQAADRRVRTDARGGGESGRPLAQRRHQPAAPDATRQARAGLPDERRARNGTRARTALAAGRATDGDRRACRQRPTVGAGNGATRRHNR